MVWGQADLVVWWDLRLCGVHIGWARLGQCHADRVYQQGIHPWFRGQLRLGLGFRGIAL